MSEEQKNMSENDPVSERKMDSPEVVALAERLLAHLHHPNYKPVKPKVIVKQLKLDDEEGPRTLKRAIKKLVKAGKAEWGGNHLVKAAAPTKTPTPGIVEIPTIARGAVGGGKFDATRVVGKFRRVMAGHGFVRPIGTPKSAERTLDIRIDAGDTLDAATGDTVAVKLDKKPRRGRDQAGGKIVEVIERAKNQFVGTYQNDAGVGYVRIDGKIFQQPIQVGDAGAKNAQPDDKVVIEMVRYPNAYDAGEGVIVEVLGARGTPGIDTLTIIREFNLPDEFPEDVLEAARKEAEKFSGEHEITAPRRDLTGLTVITIDPVDARDFDDAISLTRDERGYWKLGVHIADVSHFVRPKTPLDREAYDRATSCYLPDRVIPMLPELISNNLASLQPDKVRYVQSAFIEFDPDGIVTDVEPCLGAIKSCRRFTYEEVDDYLANRAAWKEKLTPEVHKLLGDMHELAMQQRARRFKRGSLELSMSEVKIVLDKEGAVAGARLTENTESHQMIEEFMLAANEAVARLLADREIPFLRRVHPDPDPRRLKLLTEFVKDLGIESESLESRYELQRVLKQVADKPERHAVNYAVLRSLSQAVYSPIDEGHYALASDCYCHFTSPIRRYPDLTVHRLIEAIVFDRPPVSDYDKLMLDGEHCSERERRAESAERELTKLKLLTYMSTRIGEELDAVVTGVEDFGLFVQGIEIPAEGFIHMSALAGDYYDFDRATHSLRGRSTGQLFRLGDKVRVAIAVVDLDRRSMDFRMLTGQPAPRPGELAAAAKNPPLEISRKPPKRGPGRFSGGPEKKKGKGRR